MQTLLATVERDGFLEAINLAKKATKKGTPIMESVRLEFNGPQIKSLTMTTANLDFDLPQYHVGTIQPVAVDIPGVAVVNVAKLAKCLTGLPKRARVAVSVEHGRLTLEHGSSAMRLPLVEGDDEEGDDFLMMPSEGYGGKSTMIPVPTFKRLLATAFSMSDDASRPTLSGLYLNMGSGGAVTACATDGHRLGRFTLLENDLVTGPLEGLVIVPRQTIQQLGRVLAKTTDEYVEVDHQDKWIGFQVSGVRLAARCIDGVFPDYEAVIPKTPPTFSMHIDPAAMIPGVKRIVATLDAKHSLAVFKANGNLRLTTEVDDIETTERFDYAYDGEFEVGLDGRYLLEALVSLTAVCPQGEKVHIYATDLVSPVCIEYGEALQVVMPMRI